MIDLTEIITAAVTIIMGLVTAFIIPYLKSKLRTDTLAKLQFWVNIAVEAAEMIYVGTGRGKEKKEHVKYFLESKGYSLNTAEIENLIEAACLRLNKNQKEGNK